jgi:hypothetical protein
MKVGSKYKFYIPSALGYGERGAGNTIGPNAPLVFEVELMSIAKPAEPAATPAEPGAEAKPQAATPKPTAATKPPAPKPADKKPPA